MRGSLSALLLLGACAAGPRASRAPATPDSSTRARDLVVRAEALVVLLEEGDASPESCEYTVARMSTLAAEVPARAADAHQLHARALVTCGRAEEARAVLRRALALDGRHAGALLLVARLERHAGDVDGAERHARAAIEGRRTVEGLLELSAALRERRTSEALAAAERALDEARRIDPMRADVWNALAQVYLAQAEWSPQRLEDATAACRRGAEIDPLFGPIQTTWGLVDLRKGFAETAAARFQRAMELDRSLEPRVAFGSLSVTLGAYEDARATLEEAVAREARSRRTEPALVYDAHVYLAAAFRGLRRDPEALRALQRARDLDPERPEAVAAIRSLAVTSADPEVRAEAARNLGEAGL